MRIFYYMGLGLLGLAFVAAAAETASHAMPGTDRSFIVSARDLWYTFWPASLAIFEIRITRILGPWAWDPVMTSVLSLPGWAIAGIPGVALVWRLNPHRGTVSEDEMRDAIDTFELFDELDRRARAEQVAEDRAHENHGPKDMLPDHLLGQDIAPDANRPGDFIEDADPFGHGDDESGGGRR